MRTTILLCIAILFGFQAFCQVTVSVTVDTGTSGTTCDDGFFGGPPELHWNVSVAGQTAVTYPAAGICYTNFPNIQYQETFGCPGGLPAALEVCFEPFEDDGASCIEAQSCLESICQNFAIPAIGSSTSYSLTIPNNGTNASWGNVDFTISTSGTFPPGSNMDVICDAVNLGTLALGGSIGDASLSNYGNFCALDTGEPEPWGGNNDQGVWFQFTTGAANESIITFDANSDPQNLGDDIDLQLALYESSNGACNGTLTLVQDDYQGLGLANNEDMTVNCLQPNTTYFLLVDGESTAIINPNGQEGYFGISISSGVSCSLPINLISFSGEEKERSSLLTWTTASESNNDYFTIEHSTDGIHFEIISIVNGAGNSTEINSYQLLHNNPINGINYYRLSQTDFDGTKNEYKTILVKHTRNSTTLKITPNPVGESAVLSYNSTVEGMTFYEILDASGRILEYNQVELIIGENIFPLETNELQHGIYFIRMNTKNTNNLVRFIK